MRRTFTVITAVAMMLMTAGPVSASIIERGGSSYEDQFTDTELCGFSIQVAVEGSFDYRIREGKNRRDQAYFLHVIDTWTERVAAGDRSITLSFRVMFNEIRAVPLGDGIFRFSDIETVSVVVRDASGKPIARESGVIRSSYLFDSLNDDEPGGDIIGEVDRTFHGRFDDIDSAICAALDPSGP